MRWKILLSVRKYLFYAPLTLALSNPFSVVPQHPIRTLHQSSCHKLTKNPMLTPICCKWRKFRRKRRENEKSEWNMKSFLYRARTWLFQAFIFCGCCLRSKLKKFSVFSGKQISSLFIYFQLKILWMQGIVTFYIFFKFTKRLKFFSLLENFF